MRPVTEVIKLFTSPITVISDVFWVTRATTTCGSIARFLIRSTIAFSTSAGVLPAAGTRPAYGTEMNPLVSIG